MPRGKSAVIKETIPDARYKSKIVAKMINMIMESGKKSIAKEIVYSMMESLHEDAKESRKLFEDAVRNVMPNMEVRTRRVGGANYQIPIPLRHNRAEALALRWIIDSARAAKGIPMHKKLENEIKMALRNEGNAMKKKIDTHKMADANKAFAHFAW